jgi:hypothetical protein
MSSKAESHIRSWPGIAQNKLKKSFLDKLKDKVTSKTNTNNNNSILTQEFDNYVLSPHKENESGLNFFKENKSKFPILNEIAKIIFSLTATSVPADSLFSISGIIQNDQRNRLNSKTVEMINVYKNSLL